MACINILHLSDLHFGMETGGEIQQTRVSARNRTLAELAGALERLIREKPAWKPRIVVITGDIAWKARPEDYAKAEDWLLHSLLPALGLTPNELILCPGNHDIDRRKTRGLALPQAAARADEWLVCEELFDTDSLFIRPFSAYAAFCEKLALPKPAIGGKPSYLTGVIDRGDIRFAVFNSAWFCRGDADSGNLWIGRPFLTEMTESGDIGHPDDYNNAPVTVALVHHPPEFLNEADREGTGDRPAAFEELCRQSHLVLTGHIHGKILFPPDRRRGRARLIKGGAAYGGALYRNHFTVLQIDTRARTVRQLSHEFDPRETAWFPSPIADGETPLDMRTAAAGGETGKPGARIPDAYRGWVRERCQNMDITRLIGTGPVMNVRLPELFIPLFAYPPEAEKKADKADEDPGEAFLRERETGRNIENLIEANPCLVVCGSAGSGKTTLLRHFAYREICGEDACGEDERLPVLIFLKDLKGFDAGAHPPGTSRLEALLTHWEKETGSGLDPAVIGAFCEQGRAVFLLDGLDEIPPGLRKTVLDPFTEIPRKQAGCKLILSGRPHGVDETVMARLGDRKVDILPLNMDQITEFIEKWFRFVQSAGREAARKTASDLIGEIRSHESVDALIDTPLMLTAVCLLYLDDRELPGQRAELYHRFTGNLLHRRFPAQEAETVRSYLMQLARKMHEDGVKGIDEFHAVKILGAEYPKTEGETDAAHRRRLTERFHELEPRCGMLSLRDGGYEFIHLTFQEFLAANHLVAFETGDHVKTIGRFWDNEWFQEVVQLYVGFLSIENRGIANRVVREMLDRPDGGDYRLWRLAVRAFADIHARKRNPELIVSTREKLWEIIRSEAGMPVKADAGELLGKIGDTRNLEEFVDIPDGEYETSVGKVTLKDFRIAEYPVTNRWYRRFIDAGGYKTPDLWTENGRKWLETEGATHPRYWYDHQWNGDNLPVVGVCWYEADAFRRWLTKEKDDGYVYRLPTEKEWEAVAAGKKRRKYPWGNQFDQTRCNTEEAGIEKTSAVGIFEGGKTADTYAVYDMAGNAWEWTQTDYHKMYDRKDYHFDQIGHKLYNTIREDWLGNKDEYIQYWSNKNRLLPVVRGSSWYGNASHSKCLTRSRDLPSVQLDNNCLRPICCKS